MNVGKYIYSVLTANPGVSALVGTRVYPVIIAEKAAFPSIVYTVSTTPKDKQKTAVSDHDTEVVTFHFWADLQQGADAYTKTNAIDAAVRSALDFVSGTAASVIVEHCHFDGSRDIIYEDRMLIGKEATYTFITKN